MEIIEINGYTIEEKGRLLKNTYNKQIKEHGLKSSDLGLSNKVFEAVIDGYTKECS